MRMKLQDKVVMIAGGAQGIGAKTAELAAEQGATIVLLDRTTAQLMQTVESLRSQYNVPIISFVVDILNTAERQAAIEEVINTLGRIDILINCVGVLQDNLLVNMTEQEWDFVIDVNLKGTYLLAQDVAPFMLERQQGKMIFISSQAAFGAKGRVNYAASKAGIQGITRSLALELGPAGINVNAVAPGFIDTALSEVSAQSAAKRGIEDFEAMKKNLVATNPIRRTGKPEDIAYAILFLASHEADYITGQTLVVTGAL